jgi:hypothetical protein
VLRGMVAAENNGDDVTECRRGGCCGGHGHHRARAATAVNCRTP